jgi:nucleoside-diphosphate-sugar epimerase
MNPDALKKLSKKRFVVIGANGFLGRRLVHTLRSCDLSRSNGFDLMKDSIELHRDDHVFHLAAETGVPDSWQNPVQFHAINAHGTVRVLDQCRLAQATMTYVGAYIYGAPSALPISEQHPVQANNPYAFSKWMGEEACRWYSTIFAMPVTAIRLFNVFGAGQSNRFLITYVLEQVLDKTTDTIEVQDIGPKRDYLYVDDAIQAMLASVPESGFHLFNVGSGVSYSVQQLIDMAQKLAGTAKKVVHSNTKRQNEIPDVVADCSHIFDKCGWQPQTSIEQGISRMLGEMQR